MPVCLVIQHLAAEGPYLIADALQRSGVDLDIRRMWADAALPTSFDGFDGLVVMGGPMSARSDDGFPWRRAEVGLIEQAISHEVPTLGVCLGAQLLAVAAGGEVVPGASGLEVGWAPIELSDNASADPLLTALPQSQTVLHWHGETVQLPAAMVTLASNDRYRYQAFRVGRVAWALQFHLEVSADAVGAFVEAFPDEAAVAPGGVKGIMEETPSALARLAPFSSVVLDRFAALVVGGDRRTEFAAAGR